MNKQLILSDHNCCGSNKISKNRGIRQKLNTGKKCDAAWPLPNVRDSRSSLRQSTNYVSLQKINT